MFVRFGTTARAGRREGGTYLTTEGSLVDLAVLASGEGETVVLQLTDGTGGFTAHVVDGVLVTEPIGTLDGIVEVPSPVIGVLGIEVRTGDVPCYPKRH